MGGIKVNLLWRKFFGMAKNESDRLLWKESKGGYVYIGIK